MDLDTLRGWPLFLSGCNLQVVGRVAVFADQDSGEASLVGTGGRAHVVRRVRSDSQRLCNASGPRVSHLLGARMKRPFIAVIDL